MKLPTSPGDRRTILRILYYSNAVLMLDQRLRRWPNIEPTLEECTVLEEKPSCRYMPGVSCLFEIPAIIESVSLQTQCTAKSQG